MELLKSMVKEKQYMRVIKIMGGISTYREISDFVYRVKTPPFCSYPSYLVLFMVNELNCLQKSAGNRIKQKIWLGAIPSAGVP